MNKCRSRGVTTGFLLFAMSLAVVPSAWGGLFEKIGHVHAIEAGQSANELLIGAHDGLYVLRAEEGLKRIAAYQHDFMGLARTADGALLASGHPAGGGNLGLLRSDDSGRSWQKLSDGDGGPVDFHHLAVSSDAQVLYGVYKGLQRSDDGGRNWQRIGVAPDKLFNLAVSSINPDRLYAATRQGLLRSDDQGRSWLPAHSAQAPATYVRSENGQLTAFIVGQGLVTAKEDASEWRVIANPFGGQAPMDIAVVGNAQVALTSAQKLLESRDGGATWSAWGGEVVPSDPAAQRGKALFETNCQACHGYLGMGETLVWDERANSLAPALDDSAHAWHHTDEQLVETILNGSPQGSGRMVAWKEKLSADQAREIVTYLKTLWSARALECQGPKHMSCM